MAMSSHSSTANPSYYHYDRVVYSNTTMSSGDNSSLYNEIQIDDGKWTREQTQILIDTWKDHKRTLLNTAASTAEHFKVWKLIANEVNKLSPPKSLQQCKKKFRNIRYICKTAMNNNRQAGTKKHYPIFYSDFAEIIAETERLKDPMRGETPSMEIIRDASADSIEYPSIEIEEFSPQATEQQNGVIIKPEDLQNKTKPKNLLRTKNVSSFNSTDGSFHDSPRSHESEHTSSYHGGSPPVGLDERTEMDDEKLREVRNDDSYIEDTRGDAPIRKHKNIDVSIMGRGYPPLKRIKRTSEVMFPVTNPYLLPVSNVVSSSAVIQSDTYPTMAPISHTNETYSVTSVINSNYASVALSSAAKRYNMSPNPAGNYTATKHNSPRLVPHLSTSSREGSVRGNSFQRDNSFNNSFMERSSDRYTERYADRFNDRPNDRFLDVQERQMELFSEMLSRHEQFLLRLLEQQREAAEEAQKRDREFMLKLIEMFVKHT